MMPPRPAMLNVKEVANRLGVSCASVYCKIKVRSLIPIADSRPYQFWSSDIDTYEAARRANRVRTWHGRFTATEVLLQYLAQMAPQPVRLPHLVYMLHQQGIGRRWRHPGQTTGALLARGGFRRVRRGWYTIEPSKRSPLV